MRISDWSSDVCSSDLGQRQIALADARVERLDLRFELWDGGGHRAVRHRSLGGRGESGDVACRVDETKQVREVLVTVGSRRPRQHDACAGERSKPQRRGRLQTIRALDVMRLVEYPHRSEEHTSELQSLMRISYAVFCLK